MATQNKGMSLSSCHPDPEPLNSKLYSKLKWDMSPPLLTFTNKVTLWSKVELHTIDTCFYLADVKYFLESWKAGLGNKSNFFATVYLAISWQQPEEGQKRLCKCVLRPGAFGDGNVRTRSFDIGCRKYIWCKFIENNLNG